APTPSVDVSLFATQIVNALTLGGIYALIAVGYTMVYGIIKLINFAHGEVYMMGAFTGILLVGVGVPFFLALPASMVLCALLGILIDRLAYRPLRTAPRLSALITAIGVSLFLQNLAMLMWSASERPFPDLYPAYIVQTAGADAVAHGGEYLDSVEAKLAERASSSFGPRSMERDGSELLVEFPLGSTSGDARRALRETRRETLADMPGLDLSAKESSLDHFLNKPAVSFDLGGARPVQARWKVVFIWVSTIVLMGLLEAVIKRTKVGKAMRACALDKVTAALMGIDVNRIIALTFALGSAMAAAAGILFGLYRGSGIGYRMGFQPGVFAFAAAVLGGIGNIRGAMLGGLVLGIVQVISSAYVTDWLGISSNYAFAFAFGLLILVILVRPTGLLGRATTERA
ncbi:MAG: branched-chain amino acid ABC transporter permease, partial [Candidatus Poribacteria bacterium]